MAAHLATVITYTTGNEIKGMKVSEELVSRVVGGDQTSSEDGATKLRGNGYFALLVDLFRAEPNWSAPQVAQYVADNVEFTD